jgi:hypothetical protein
MKFNALFGLRLLLGLLLLAVGSGQTGGVDLVVQQIRTIGPRQWLSLVAGSIMSNAPVVAPVSQRMARATAESLWRWPFPTLARNANPASPAVIHQARAADRAV